MLCAGDSSQSHNSTTPRLVHTVTVGRVHAAAMHIKRSGVGSACLSLSLVCTVFPPSALSCADSCWKTSGVEMVFTSLLPSLLISATLPHHLFTHSTPSAHIPLSLATHHHPVHHSESGETAIGSSWQFRNQTERVKWSEVKLLTRRKILCSNIVWSLLCFCKTPHQKKKNLLQCETIQSHY